LDTLKHSSQEESTFSLTELPCRFTYTTESTNITEHRQCGKGTFGIVHEALESTQEHPSISRKIATKRSAKDKEHKALQNERNILCSLDHPHIVRIFCFTSATPPAQVMELCTGGELFSIISSQGSLPDNTARDYFRQILLALNYLHSVMRIVHRDLKPENILLCPNRKVVKLCDFGTAVRLPSGRGSKANGRIGSLSYAAPEVYKSAISDFSSDMWSAGVLLYVMMCAASPFRNSDDSNPEEAAVERVKRGDLNTKRPRWKQMSEGPKKLILKLLQVDSDCRLTAREALQDPWIATHSDRDYLVQLGKEVTPAIDMFLDIEDPDTRSVWMCLASQMGDWERARNIFEVLDSDCDGVLGFGDLSLCGYPVSVDKTFLSYSEFVAAMLMHSPVTQRAEIIKEVVPFAFKAMGSDPAILDLACFQRLTCTDIQRST
jgi:calcium-dependent protein kinase